MGKIKQLSLHEAQKIAAGEVVERPANIVKELIENALDAGARHISIAIIDGGKELIRVTDDGCGMDADDAQLCFLKHATSKLHTVDELAHLSTHGFRGEALASIAAISNIVMITKQTESTTATRIEMQYGVEHSNSECAHTVGTDIRITRLFDNIPARKKFLKSRETEQRHITQLLCAYILGYPSVDFSYAIDEIVIWDVRATQSPQERAQLILDTEHLLSVNVSDESYGVAISGYISDQQTTRYDRNSCFFLVNGRWIKNQHLVSAFIKGYKQVLPPGKYPLCSLRISIPTTDIDINIHPRKEEIKFLNPRIVEKLLQVAVTRALEEGVSISLRKADPIALHVQPRIYESALSLAQSPKDNFIPFNFDQFFVSAQNNTFLQATPIAQESEHVPITQAQTVVESVACEEQTYTILGQLLLTYIILEQDNGLCIVDQHAAHERILYEKFDSRFETIESTGLLFPVVISLSEKEQKLLFPYITILQHYGVTIEQFGQSQIIIRATPICAKQFNWQEFFVQLVHEIYQEEFVDTNDIALRVTHKIRAQLACKAAVKAGDILSHAEMQKIIRDLYIVDNRFSCPHGRPTIISFTRYDLEKKFKRV